ncbi:MAG: glycosyltransferase family 39 protein [Candidatus Hydrothermarchaeaceae archaeon]
MPKKSKKDPLSRLSDFDIKRASLLVFSTAFFIRLLLNVIFFERFGYRAVQYQEIWFYYGVAQGKFSLMALDPTVPILKAVNIFFGDFLIYGIVIAGIALSSLTSVFLFLLVRKLHDSRTGIFAGLLYAALSFSSSLTTAGFTHDLVAVPIIVLIMYLAVISSGGHLPKLLMLLLIVVGASVNPMVVFGVFAVMTHFAMQKSDKGFGKFAKNFLWIVFAALLIRLLFYQEILDYIAVLAFKYRSIDLLIQQRFSEDLLPPDLDILAIGYNFLWILAPIGILISLKKRDSMSPSLFLLGILAVSVMSKGTRILDLGMCMTGAVGFANLKKYQSYAMPFLAIFALSNLAIASYYSPSDFTQTEYEVFTWLEENTGPGDTLYAKWAYGYTLQALSNLEPVSTPERIRPEIYSILWLQDEKEMANGMSLLGARYVLLSEEDFFFYEDAKRFHVVMKESMFPIYKSGAGEALLPEIKKTMIYRLLYDGELRQFTVLKEWKDPDTELRYRVLEFRPL